MTTDNLENEELQDGSNEQNIDNGKGNNKPQPNLIKSKADVNRNSATSYHDKERVSPRANEASDRNDTNTGGIISGGAKGTSQS